MKIPRRSAPSGGAFVYAGYAAAIGLGGVNWYFLSGASVNIWKTFGVCLVIFLLPLSGCSPKTEFERTVERATAGDKSAQTNLGVIYENGGAVGGQWDYAEAVKWYRMAAEQGDAKAQTNLGLMYYNGTGVTQDYAEAMKWYRLAAEQGVAGAQNNLGLMYNKGDGVPQDYAEAYAWFFVAATGGSIDAEKYRDTVQEILTAEQLAEAQKRATELFEKYGSGK